MTTLSSHLFRILGPRTFRTGRWLACAAVLTAAPASPLLPALRAAPTPAATASPAAAADTPLDALDPTALRGHLNEQVKVRGTPTAIGHSKAGNVAYLNFAAAHQAVSLVFFFKPGQTGTLTSADDLKPFVGKAIVVTGKLTDYKGDLQIVVESADQIKVAP